METDSNLISQMARQIHIFIKKGVAVHYVLIFTVFGGLPVFLRIAAISANLTWAVGSYFTWKFTGNKRMAAAEQLSVRDLRRTCYESNHISSRPRNTNPVSPWRTSEVPDHLQQYRLDDSRSTNMMPSRAPGSGRLELPSGTKGIRSSGM